MLLQAQIQRKLKNFTLQAQLELKQGQLLGLMGPSGSGKSMLLKILAGLEPADRGSIYLNNSCLYNSEEKICLRPQQRHIGYLFQSYALFPNMTVVGNIACVLRAQGCYSQERVQELVQRFKLQGLEQHYPQQLSGGQKQRTALARLLVSRPKVVLLDEPFAALDTELKQELYVELLQLFKQEGLSGIIVSHDQQELLQLADKILYISNGGISNEKN